jgi:hypothetical protein
VVNGPRIVTPVVVIPAALIALPIVVVNAPRIAPRNVVRTAQNAVTSAPQSVIPTVIRIGIEVATAI